MEPYDPNKETSAQRSARKKRERQEFLAQQRDEKEFQPRDEEERRNAEAEDKHAAENFAAILNLAAQMDDDQFEAWTKKFGSKSKMRKANTNKKSLNAARKQKQKQKGGMCALLFLALASVGAGLVGAVGWGAYELVALAF